MTKYGLRVLINGKYATQYNSNGDLYLEGRPGSTYELELRNNTNTEAEFVVSVDGLSIIDGKPAGSASTGYIIGAWQTARIKGWKVDSETAAEFKFGAKSKSYAAKSEAGDVQNAGVIGLQVFPKKYVAPPYIHHVNPLWEDPWYTPTFGRLETRSRSAELTKSASSKRRVLPTNAALNNMAVGMAAVTMDCAATPESFTSSVGTEFGDATSFKTTKVNFERASSTPTLTSVLYYGDAKDLNKLGIVLDWQKPTTVKPQAFPADGCVPPKGWRK